MPIEIVIDGGVHTVRISGAANVRIVSEVRTALLEAVAEGESAALDLTDATSIDAAFFQLIASALESGDDAAVGVTVIDPAGLVSQVF